MYLDVLGCTCRMYNLERLYISAISDTCNKLITLGTAQNLPRGQQLAPRATAIWLLLAPPRYLVIHIYLCQTATYSSKINLSSYTAYLLQISVTLFHIQPSFGHKAPRHPSVRAVGCSYGTVQAWAWDVHRLESSTSIGGNCSILKPWLYNN